MNHIDVRKLAEYLNVSPDVAGRLAAAMEGNASSSGGAPSVRTKLQFHLMPSVSLREQPHGGRKRTRDERFDSQLARLSPGLRKKLLAIEPRVLSFVNESRENAAVMAADPIGALRQMGIDNALIEELAAIRRSGSVHQYNVPGLEIDTIELDARGEEPRSRKS